MPTATIVVKYKNPRQYEPKRKPPNVKTSDDVIYSMNDEVAATIEQGKTYQIEYHTQKSTDGKHEFKILDKAQEVVSGNGSSTPAGSTAKRNGAYGPVDKETAERIFVCGAVNACLSNPGEAIKFYVDRPAEAVKLVNLWRETWKRTFGGQPTLQDEMGGDEIPGL